jgi:HAD superfamily, subfamily IIIB (Acid phosphatase)
MEHTEVLNIVATKFDLLIAEADSVEHKELLKKTKETLLEQLNLWCQVQTAPGFPYPHPRSRTYRSQPHHWHIQDISGLEVLESLLNTLEQHQTRTACVFDLDGTLFDVGYRTLGILNEWLESAAPRSFREPLVSKVRRINLRHMGYSLAHAFENAGFDMRDQEVLNIFTEIEHAWKKRFFDGKSLLKYDKTLNGAQEFVSALYTRGVHVVYLTGRHKVKMFEGSQEQLKQHGFPIENTELILKTDPFAEDHLYKAQVLETLGKKYTVIGNFENEYINIASMATKAPHAMHVIVDSQHSGRNVPELGIPVYRIQEFKK